MFPFIDRIRQKLGNRTISVDSLNEQKDNGMDLTGYTFKSINDIGSKKANMDWLPSDKEYNTMFGEAQEGMPQYPDDDNTPRNSDDDPENALTGALDITPETYDIDSDLVPPRDEWLAKREAKQKSMQPQDNM